MKNVELRSLPLSVVPAKQEAAWWLFRHKQKLAEKAAMKCVDLVFLGDSITQAWETNGRDYWDKYYGSLNALNLGCNGDCTEHVLWRLAHGAVDGIAPKLLVLLIGTNNTGHRQDDAEETLLGIQQIISLLLEKLPTSNILLLSIFPRSAKSTQRLRVINDAVNSLIPSLCDQQKIYHLDISHHFLASNGLLTKEIMSDFLHLNTDQYKVWAEAMRPYITKLMIES